MALRKTYIYKSSRNGVFLGVLQNVRSQFSYTHQINTAFAQTVIEVGAKPLRARDDVSILTTESGDILTDESGNPLVTERAVDVFGNSADNILIRNNNDVEVVEYSANNPNGVTVFKGYINYVDVSLSATDTKLALTVVSHGYDMNNILYPGTGVVVLQQNTSDSQTSVYIDSSGVKHGMIQTIQGTAGIIDSIIIATQNLDGTLGGGIQVAIWEQVSDPPLPSGASGANILLGITEPLLNVSTAVTLDVLYFTSNITFNATSVYYIEVLPYGTINTDRIATQSKSTNPYANGQLYLYDITAGVPNVASFSAYDMAFFLMRTSSSKSQFTNYPVSDGTNGVNVVIDTYRTLGGLINYAVGSIDVDATNVRVNYTFNTQTMWEVILKFLQIAPSDFYCYVDPATDIFYFKETATTAAHKFVIGNHISDNLTFRQTVENIANKVPFSGGDTGAGVNLFSIYTNNTSITNNNNRVFLKKVSDNRVIVQSMADTIGNNTLNEHPSEEYTTVITVFDAKYDTSTIKLGATVSIQGTGTFIDSLVLQVSQIKRFPEGVELTLGPLLTTASGIISNAISALDLIQTVDNSTITS